MAQRGKPGLPPEGKAEVWRRWRAGELFLGVGKALGKPAGSIYGVIQLLGGYSSLGEWSSEQVSGWLKRRYTDDEWMRVSHETICRSLFVQARGVLKKELQYNCGPSARCVIRASPALLHGTQLDQYSQAQLKKSQPASMRG
ncbi:hypothetical protein [Robbsia andropogonis]|uniref:hypothetical protein n=1 Tax=Robbsia andropogonis TaxID=28092 RepID=UPI000B01BCC9